MRRYLLAFDADCGPCTRFKGIVDFLDTYRRFDFKSLVEADEEGFLDTIPKSVRHRSFHLVTPSGRVSSGAEALPNLVALLPSGGPISRLITSAPGGLRTVGFVYAIFSRLHDTGSCAYKSRQYSGAGRLTESPIQTITPY